MRIQKYLPNVVLVICSIMSTSSFAQTVLWDFENSTLYQYPDDWDFTYTCALVGGEMNVDCAGPALLNYDLYDGSGGSLGKVLGLDDLFIGYQDLAYFDNTVTSPLFLSAAPGSTRDIDADVVTENVSAGPILSFLIHYNNIAVVSYGDGFTAELIDEASQEVEQLLSLSLTEKGEWRTLDQADGVADQVIRLSYAIEPETQYRLRFRVYDYDAQIIYYPVFGIDDIAVTNGVLVGSTPSLSGDFDEDGDIDGQDFLEWQRGNLLSPFSTTDLQSWQTNYGQALSTVVGVPEPTTGLLLLMGLLVFHWGEWLSRSFGGVFHFRIAGKLCTTFEQGRIDFTNLVSRDQKL